MTTDDAQVWRDRVLRAAGGQPTESTSARLRQALQDLAASQADLTHVERQLADAESERMKTERERDEVCAVNLRMRGEIGRLRTEADRANARAERLSAENDALGRLVADATALFERRPGAHTPITEEKSKTMAQRAAAARFAENEWRLP
jgi:chromosome segregation ATPase